MLLYMCTVTSHKECIWNVLALLRGLLAAIVEMHSPEPQLPVVFLFVFGLVFGFAQPANAWRWAILLTLWIPVLHLLNAMVRVPGPRDLGLLARLFLGPLVAFFRCSWCASEPAGPVTLGSTLVLLPAMAGAYTGVWLSHDQRQPAVTQPRRGA